MELIHYRLKMFYQSNSVVGAQKVQIPGAVNSLIQVLEVSSFGLQNSVRRKMPVGWGAGGVRSL